MHTRALQKRDYDLVVQLIDHWWGGPTSALVHPIFFYELGEMAKIVERDGTTIGFLLGFVSTPKASAESVGYVHLVGTHPDHRRQGVGRLLYGTFETECLRAGAHRMKAVTTLGNELSQRFHQALGWDMCEHSDYAGAGRARMVFTKNLHSRSHTT
jgi:GNAT superfamily N-acetyltransferase